MTINATREEAFDSLIENLASSSHGSKELKAIKDFLGSELKKTAHREAFLLPQLTQEAIEWEEVKDSIWDTEEQRQINRFPFLQGDIVQTSSVLALGIAQTTQTHDLWMILAPDCDCVRAAYVRVAPVFAVHKGAMADQLRTQRFGHTLKLSSPKAFPLPPLPGDDDEDLRGYFADLDQPYYISDRYRRLATPCASLTVAGWHLLNGLIQDKETRAINIVEATAIRTAKD